MVEITPRQLIVVCAGGHAGELASYIRDLRIVGDPLIVRGYVDDHRFESTFEGAPLLGGIPELGQFLTAHASTSFLYVAAVSDNRTRAEIVRRVERLGASNLTPISLQHTTAVVGESVTIGTGTCIGPGAILTSRVTVGEHCILNANASVSHDSVLASYVNVNPGASICGGVTINEGSYIGAGATVIDEVQVGAWSIVAAGTVVMDDVPAHVTVAGTPARIVQRHGRGTRHSSLAG